jgi:hypothetical protein
MSKLFAALLFIASSVFAQVNHGVTSMLPPQTTDPSTSAGACADYAASPETLTTVLNTASSPNHLWWCDFTGTWQIVGNNTGGGNTTSSGLTGNYLPKANGANSIVNSTLQDTGSQVQTTEPLQAGSFTTGSVFSVTGLYATGGGTAQAQTVTLSSSVASLAAGLTFCFLPAAANTAAAPGLVVTGASAFASKPVTKLGATALAANDLTATAVACVIYDGTEYQLQNPQTPNATYNLIQTSGSPYAMPALAGTYWNNTASPYSWDLPTPAAGLQLCIGNYKAQAAAQSLIPGSGVTIYFKGVAGTAGSSTGLVSGGAAGDFICLEGTDSTTYMATGAGYGTWTNH